MRGGTDTRPENGDGIGFGGLTCGADEVSALVGNRVPVPLEELNDDLYREKNKDG